MTLWKKTHFALMAVLACSGAVGFCMDPTLNVLIEEKRDAWLEYTKVHPQVVKLAKGKCFPWHVRWRYIFSNDQAPRVERVDISDAMNEVGNKEYATFSGEWV